MVGGCISVVGGHDDDKGHPARFRSCRRGWWSRLFAKASRERALIYPCGHAAPKAHETSLLSPSIILRDQRICRTDLLAQRGQIFSTANVLIDPVKRYSYQIAII